MTSPACVCLAWLGTVCCKFACVPSLSSECPRVLPDAATAEPKASDALEEAWKAAEVGPETFEEKVPKEEEEEVEEEAKDAQKTTWRSSWAGWESDVEEEEEQWEEEVKEPIKGKGEAKGKGKGRGAYRAGLGRLAGSPWQEMTRTRSGQPLSYLYTQTQALSIVL